jgi:hypothetical protein
MTKTPRASDPIAQISQYPFMEVSNVLSSVQREHSISRLFQSRTLQLLAAPITILGSEKFGAAE